jgi:hypothetical protein
MNYERAERAVAVVPWPLTCFGLMARAQVADAER